MVSNLEYLTMYFLLCLFLNHIGFYYWLGGEWRGGLGKGYRDDTDEGWSGK